MAESDANPYAAPETPLNLPPAAGRKTGRSWHLVWMGVFGINLIVPLLFGLDVAQGDARIGMASAMLLMLLIGHLVIARSKTLGFNLVAGGICVGLTQILPGLQFLAGFISLEVVATLMHMPSPLDDDRGPHISTLSGGFLTTLLTGGILLVAALVAGQMVLVFLRTWKKRHQLMTTP